MVTLANVGRIVWIKIFTKSIITDDISINQRRIKDTSITKKTGVFLLISKRGVYMNTRGGLERKNATGKRLSPLLQPSPTQHFPRRQRDVVWLPFNSHLPGNTCTTQTLPFWPGPCQKEAIGPPRKIQVVIIQFQSFLNTLYAHHIYNHHIKCSVFLYRPRFREA